MSLQNIFSKKNRALMRELVITDFKLRYQGSALGYLWSLLKPLLLFTILYVVFVQFLKFGADIEHFAVYLLLGVVLWSFFTEVTSQGMQAIVARGDLIRKINFPKYIVVISGTISALINLMLNLVVVFLFAMVNGVDFKASAIWFPLNILELYMFAVAIAFLLAAIYVKYRDMSHIWEVLLQGAFYATPILYSLSMVTKFSTIAAQIMLLNPVAQIMQDARYNLITHQTPTTFSMVGEPLLIAIPFAIVAVMVVFATWYFKKHARYFAENV